MENKLNIIQIIPTLELGGAEIMVENLSTALIDEGYNLTIISFYDFHSAITERLESKNVKIYYLGKKKGFDVRIIYKIYSLFKIEKPNAIHTHLHSMPYVIPAAILANVKKRVHTIHSLANKEVSRAKRKINSYFYKFCHVVPVSISPVVQQSIIEEYKLLEQQVPIIFNGIDLNKCIQKTEYKMKKPISIIHIGSFKEAKNHIAIIESFKMIHDQEPNTILKLIGVGELEQTIREKTLEYGLSDCVQFLGIKSNVYHYLNEADIFIFPSLWEGMPITIIEAMATGLPIVATKVGGIVDMIQDNVTGILVEVNYIKISEAVLKLINDEDLRQRLGRAAILASNKFSADIMAKEYSKLYR